MAKSPPPAKKQIRLAGKPASLMRFKSCKAAAALFDFYLGHLSGKLGSHHRNHSLHREHEPV